MAESSQLARHTIMDDPYAANMRLSYRYIFVVFLKKPITLRGRKKRFEVL